MTEDRPKRGEARRRRTRGQILKAASALFYAEGVRAVGVDRVAATANVSKRTLYNHFPSKDDLICESEYSTSPDIESGAVECRCLVDSYKY